MKQQAILCRNLCFSYDPDPRPVLQNLDLEIEPGEFVVLAGPSGAGKSTFCRTLNNIIPLYYKGNLSGERSVAGEPVGKQPISSMAHKVGMVFQDFEQQLFSTNVILELAFGMENFQVAPEEMDNRITLLMEKFHISHLKKREPHSLSGGEKQKLAIASVMAGMPPILVLDEPTTDLDPESRELLLQTIPQLKEWVETLIVVDQETDQFLTADRLFLIREGRIDAGGITVDILRQAELLERNALRAPDVVRLQHALGRTAQYLSVPDLEAALSGYHLEKSPVPKRSSNPIVVEVDRLSYRYKGEERYALEDLSFEIHRGEFVGIIGNNGSGKSTLLRHLNGLQNVQSGSLNVLEKPAGQWDSKELAKTVGLVFQNPDHQIFETSVKTEVEFGPRQFGFTPEQTEINVKQALEIMDLTALSERDPFQLSKGERQRVAVASILSVHPEILILDEPTTGLDFRQQKYLMDLLREFNNQGTTVIVVTHALWLVSEYCNYAILLSNGKKVAEGHPRELFFQGSNVNKLPPLLDLSRRMNGNALTVEEFAAGLRRKGN